MKSSSVTAVQLKPAPDRTTKYVSAVRRIMAGLGHATNYEIQTRLSDYYPDISATTVHRITARLCERGELQLAPSGTANVLRYDANVSPHDHFMCEVCGMLRDAQLRDVVTPAIEKAVGDGCTISGSLTVSDVCKHCYKEGM